MDKKISIALAIAALLASGALIYAVIASSSDGDDGDTPNNPAHEKVTVHFMRDGTWDEKEADGSSLREVFDDAVEGIVFNSAGQILSVGGVEAGADQKWIMWTWSNEKWSPISSVNDDVELHNRTHLALMLSDKEVKDNVTSYTGPGFPIMQKVWFFIKFVEDFDANSYVTSYLTSEERQAGFWVSGEGINAAYALQDVAERLDWDLSMDMEKTPNGWLWHFFGLTDARNSIDGNWTYWSQYYWDGERWLYGQSVLGGYDIAEDYYFALVRQTPSDGGLGFKWNVTPKDIPPSLLV